MRWARRRFNPFTLRAWRRSGRLRVLAMSNAAEVPEALRLRDLVAVERAKPDTLAGRRCGVFDAAVPVCADVSRTMTPAELQTANDARVMLCEAQRCIVEAYRAINKVRLPLAALHYRTASAGVGSAILTLDDLLMANTELVGRMHRAL